MKKQEKSTSGQIMGIEQNNTFEKVLHEMHEHQAYYASFHPFEQAYN